MHGWLDPAFLHVGISARELRHLKRFGKEVSSSFLQVLTDGETADSRPGDQPQHQPRPNLGGGGGQERTHSNPKCLKCLKNPGTVCV